MTCYNFTWRVIMNKKNYYDILNVSKDATEEEIKKSFISLSKKYKSSKSIDAQNKLDDINEAYNNLYFYKKRKEYDLSLEESSYFLSNDKLKNIVIILLVCIIIFGGSYAASIISNYKKSCVKDNDISLNNKFNNIDIEKYLSLFNGDSLSLIYIGREDCSFSTAENSVFEDILSEYSIDINYLNLDSLSNSGLETLYSSYDYFVENGLATPTIMLVQNGEVKMFKKGYTSKEDLIELFKANNFITE